MTPTRLALAAALAAPLSASAQTASLVERERGGPVGLALPSVSVAGAEEPTALTLNPAGAGFAGGPSLHYFHQEARSFTGDGVYAALPLGPLVPALSVEWVRPAPGGGPRYRKTGLALALAGGQVASLGFAWNFYSSPDPAWSDLFGMDLGLTVRPLRSLSLGASVLGLESRLGGRPLPVRYGFGAAARLLGDALTVSADLYCDDDARGSFAARHAAVGLAAEVLAGVGIQLQYQHPLRSGRPGFEDGAAFLATVSASAGQGGAVVGGSGAGTSGDPRRTAGWLLGARLSAERYPGLALGSRAAVLDLAAALRPPFRLFGRDPDPYATLLGRLGDARADPSVAALVVKIARLPVGPARAEELRAALSAVKEVKPVVAWLAGDLGAGTGEYLVASAASAVLAPPGSHVVVNGVSHTGLYLKEGLARLGIAVEAVATGPYKNAPDLFTRSDMSAGEREALQAILDDRFARQVRTIAAARGLPEGRVRELLDVGVFSAEEARRAGLLDATAWPDEIEAAASRLAGRRVRLDEDYRRPALRAAARWGPRPRVAVVSLRGAIVAGETRREPFGLERMAGAETVERQLREAGESAAVKAVVLRVESPGGDAAAAERLWRAVGEARRRGKPVVVSLGDQATSGAYLAAVGADAIVAEPSSLTGSIGVFALKPDLSGLLEKLGVRTASLQRGDKARIRSLAKSWTPEERRLVQRQVEAQYRSFLGHVAEGRRLSPEEVERSAGGRVWTGEQALARGLVDRLGGLRDAVALARERAGLPPGEGELVRIDPESGFLERLASGLADGGAAESTLSHLAAEVPELRTLGALSQMGPLLALPVPWIGAPPSE